MSIVFTTLNVCGMNENKTKVKVMMPLPKVGEWQVPQIRQAEPSGRCCSLSIPFQTEGARDAHRAKEEASSEVLVKARGV